jgi:hypothetical protein
MRRATGMIEEKFLAGKDDDDDDPFEKYLCEGIETIFFMGCVSIFHY